MRKSCARAAAFIRRTFSFALATAEARVPPVQLRGGARQDNLLASEIAHGIDCQCYFTDNFFVPNRGHYVFHGAHRFKAEHAAVCAQAEERSSMLEHERSSHAQAQRALRLQAAILGDAIEESEGETVAALRRLQQVEAQLASANAEIESEIPALAIFNACRVFRA